MSATITTVTDHRIDGPVTYRLTVEEYVGATGSTRYRVARVAADGTLEEAWIGGSYRTAAEVEAVIAKHAAAKAGQAPRTGEYTEVESPVYGTGRRYHDQPGATQYDDGSGRYTVQIWDES